MTWEGGMPMGRTISNMQRLAKALTGGIVAAASVLLGGCFLSEEAKFPPASAVAAFGEGGRYDVFEHVEGDTYKRQETFVVKRRPDGAYDFTNEKGESSAMPFFQVAGDRFVVQSPATPGSKGGFAYVVFRIAGNEAFLYIPQCEAQDKDKLAAARVELRGLECFIDMATDPAALFATVKLGDPVSKMVRQ
jgi:hypothetical protein